jgi:protein gp37
MAATTIAWTDHSINPIRFGVGHFCQKLSPGCANCYASDLQRRFGTPEFKGTGGPLPMAVNEQGPRGQSLWLDESKLREVLRRKKPTKYFWCDMTDLFGSWVPDEWIDACFRAMAETPQHIHQVLTKRAKRMRDYCSRRWGTFDGKLYPPPRNVWLGVSVEDQQRADERIPRLCNTPAAVRFLSVEPLLGPVELRFLHLIQWVIVGGESGHGARPCNVAWVRSIVRQCKAAGVSCFVKQLGSRRFDSFYRAGVADQRVTLRDRKGGDPEEWPEDLRVRDFPEEPAMAGA